MVKTMRAENNSSGFTLVEIVVSVVILGMGLTSLIGIQSNYIDGYIREENLTRAAMYGQYIMSMIEVEVDPPESGKNSGNLDNYLKELGYFDENFKDGEHVSLDGWNFELDVESVDILLITDAMKRVDLTISWSEYDLDSFRLIYYVSNPPDTNG